MGGNFRAGRGPATPVATEKRNECGQVIGVRISVVPLSVIYFSRYQAGPWRTEVPILFDSVDHAPRAWRKPQAARARKKSNDLYARRPGRRHPKSAPARKRCVCREP